MLYRIVYYGEPYTVISSRVDDTAVELLDEIKHELFDNDKLIDYYGALKGDSSYAWSDHFVELTNGARVRAVGWGGNVRARKRGGYRITLFVGDDPEEVADLSSPAILKAHIKWLKRSAVPRTDKEHGKIRIVGTLIGLGGTLDNLMKDPRWRGKVYKALVDNPGKPGSESVLPIEQRKSIWEEKWPTAFLQKERQQALRAGEIDDWMFERMNEPVASLVKNLKGYKFHHARLDRKNEQNLLWIPECQDPIPVFTYCGIDPAFSQAATADERAIVSFAVGMFPDESGIKQPTCWVLEYDFNHMDPDEIIERAVELHKKFFYRSLVVETVGGQKIFEFITNKILKKDKFLNKYPFMPEYINYQPRSKEDRIYTFFKVKVKMGQLYVRPNMYALIDELDLFLQSSHLHLLDALEMGWRFAIPCREDEVRQNPKSRFIEKQTVRDWREW